MYVYLFVINIMADVSKQRTALIGSLRECSGKKRESTFAISSSVYYL